MWLTIDVVLKYPDALLVQGHHFGEIGTFGARIHLHLRIHSSSSESSFLLLLGWRQRYRARKTGLHVTKGTELCRESSLSLALPRLPTALSQRQPMLPVLCIPPSLCKINKCAFYSIFTNNTHCPCSFIYRILEIIPYQTKSVHTYHSCRGCYCVDEL